MTDAAETIERSVTHATFAVERSYDASPARVFVAWAEPEGKARWFGNPEDGVAEFELDFRVGGREFNRGKVEGRGTRTRPATRTSFPTCGSCTRTTCTSRERGSRCPRDGRARARGDGTRLTYTEQGPTSTASTRRTSANPAPAGCSMPSAPSSRARK